MLRRRDRESDCWVEGDDGGDGGGASSRIYGLKLATDRELVMVLRANSGIHRRSEPTRGQSLRALGSCARLFDVDGQDRCTCHKWLAVVVFTDVTSSDDGGSEAEGPGVLSRCRPRQALFRELGVSGALPRLQVVPC